MDKLLPCPFCELGKYNIEVGGRLFPIAFLAKYEPRAMKNHSQSLKRLSERGGLSWVEGYCIIRDMGFFDYTFGDEETAKTIFLEKFQAWNTRALKPLDELEVESIVDKFMFHTEIGVINPTSTEIAKAICLQFGVQGKGGE